MSGSDRLAEAATQARQLPAVLRYGASVAVVVAVFLLWRAVDPLLPATFPFLPFFLAILASAALFDRGCGMLATLLSTILALLFFVPHEGNFALGDGRQLAGVLLFAGIGLVMSAVIEALHQAVAGLQQANQRLSESERSRALLLHEFRHRTRNDLASLAGLLHLRARSAASESAREGLKEAAAHAMALARVHTRLVASDGGEGSVADTREFILGLCTDLNAAQAGEGLRPIALVAEAEAHPLESERAVQLGLVLNEAVTNALKYAFPEEKGGTVTVRFNRDGADYVLHVSDDGVGLPPEGDTAPETAASRGTGLGTRLLRALAAQLRGAFTRRAVDGGGTVTELRFPVQAPG